MFSFWDLQLHRETRVNCSADGFPMHTARVREAKENTPVYCAVSQLQKQVAVFSQVGPADTGGERGAEVCMYVCMYVCLLTYRCASCDGCICAAVAVILAAALRLLKARRRVISNLG
jgi:hypothetical protein